MPQTGLMAIKRTLELYGIDMTPTQMLATELLSKHTMINLIKMWQAGKYIRFHHTLYTQIIRYRARVNPDEVREYLETKVDPFAY